MPIKKNYIIGIAILFFSCHAIQDVATDTDLFLIGFTGNDIENKVIEFYYDDQLIFENIDLKRRQNGMNL